jgi:hypothetical protein
LYAFRDAEFGVELLDLVSRGSDVDSRADGRFAADGRSRLGKSYTARGCRSDDRIDANRVARELGLCLALDLHASSDD